MFPSVARKVDLFQPPLKALKALKKAQIGVQIGGPLCEKTERDRGMKISDLVDLVDFVDFIGRCIKICENLI